MRLFTKLGRWTHWLGWFLLSWGWILWKGKWEPKLVGAHMLTSNFYYASWAKKLPKNLTFIGTFSATKTIWCDFLWWRNLGPLPTEKCLQQQGQNHPLRIFKEIGKLRSSPPTVISKSKKSISSNFPCSLYFQIASPLNLPAHRGKKKKNAQFFWGGDERRPLRAHWDWREKLVPFCGIPWQSGMNFALCEISSKKKNIHTKTVNMAVIFGPFPKVWAFFQLSGNWKSSTWSRNTLKLLGEMSSPVVSGPESQLQRRGLSAWKFQHQFTQKTDMSCREFSSI